MQGRRCCYHCNCEIGLAKGSPFLGNEFTWPAKDASQVKSEVNEYAMSVFVCVCLAVCVCVCLNVCVIYGAYVPHNANLKNNFRNYPENKNKERAMPDLISFSCACALTCAHAH